MDRGRGKRTKRVLAPEDLRAWEHYANQVEPMRHGSERSARKDAKADPPPSSDALEKRPPTPPRPSESRPSRPQIVRPRGRPEPRVSVAIESSPPVARPIGRSEPGLDRRTVERLRKGLCEPEERIDLHGMTAERARSACQTFLGDALARRRRLVLIITGKGRGEDGRGVIRTALPGWLETSSLRPRIVRYFEAHSSHGGAGAVYVLLKQRH